MQYSSACRKQDCDRLQPFGILQVNVWNDESYSSLQAITVSYMYYEQHINYLNVTRN